MSADDALMHVSEWAKMAASCAVLAKELPV